MPRKTPAHSAQICAKEIHGFNDVRSCTTVLESKPQLSWDKDDTERVQTMRRDLSKSEVREMEYAAYLASSCEDSDEGEEEYVFQGGRAPKRGRPRAATAR